MSIWEKIEKMYEIVLKTDNNFFIKYSVYFVAFIPFIGVLLQLLLSNKNIKENRQFEDKWKQKQVNIDIISKSIVVWLEGAREISANLTTAAIKINQKFNNFCYYGNKASEHQKTILVKKSLIQKLPKKEKQQRKDLSDEIEMLSKVRDQFELLANQCLEESREARSIFHQNQVHFSLMFGDNEENNDLLNQVDSINERMNWFIDDQLKVGKQIEWEELEEYCLWNTFIIDEKLAEFVLSCRVYYKKEWDKAKSGTILNENDPK